MYEFAVLVVVIMAAAVALGVGIFIGMEVQERRDAQYITAVMSHSRTMDLIEGPREASKVPRLLGADEADLGRILSEIRHWNDRIEETLPKAAKVMEDAATVIFLKRDRRSLAMWESQHEHELHGRLVEIGAELESILQAKHIISDGGNEDDGRGDRNPVSDVPAA